MRREKDEREGRERSESEGREERERRDAPRAGGPTDRESHRATPPSSLVLAPYLALSRPPAHAPNAERAARALRFLRPAPPAPRAIMKPSLSLAYHSAMTTVARPRRRPFSPRRQRHLALQSRKRRAAIRIQSLTRVRLASKRVQALREQRDAAVRLQRCARAMTGVVQINGRQPQPNADNSESQPQQTLTSTGLESSHQVPANTHHVVATSPYSAECSLAGMLRELMLHK